MGADIYASLDALRLANDELLRLVTRDDVKLEAKRNRIAEFIERAGRSGVMFDKLRDRKTIQGLIDYWSASYHTISRDLRGERRGLLPKAVLLGFERDAVEELVLAGDRTIGKMGKADRELARRILVQLAIAPRELRSSQRVTEELARKGTYSNDVERVLGYLKDAGLVIRHRLDEASQRNEPPPNERQTDVLSLSSDALSTNWTFLEEAVRERIDFRQLALAWSRGGSRSGELLDVHAATRFEAFDDLSNIERDFIEVSKRSASLRNLRLSAIGLAICVLGASVMVAYDEIIIPREVTKVSERIASGSSTNLGRDLRWLSENGQRFVLRGARLNGTDLRGVQAETSDFTSASITNVEFGLREDNSWRQLLGFKDEQSVLERRSRLTASNFVQATIDDVKFDNANLRSARFDNAVFGRTSFRGADLSSATFDGASFCGQVNFSGSNLSWTSFKNIQFASPPVFDEVAWWLMQDFDPQQLSKMERAIDPETIPSLHAELKDIDKSISEARDPLVHAKWQAQKAWTLAIYGARREDAKAAIRQALSELQGLKQPPDDVSRLVANMQDTEGYIALQFAQASPAGDLRTAQLREAEGLLSAAAVYDTDGAVTFRHAIALNALGRTADANRALVVALTERGYSPTHEMHVLSGLIEEDFGKRTGAALKKKPTPSNPQACKSR